MTKVVNFFGGPAAGKSTLAAQLFGHMKSLRMNVEYVSEFAKDLVWEKSESIRDQLYIFGEQHNRVYRLLGQTDYVICDSPLLLTMYYAKTGNPKYQDNPYYPDWVHLMTLLSRRTFMMYDNINFFAERGDRKFIQEGRIHTESQSRDIDKELRGILDREIIPYLVVSSLEDVLGELGVK